MPSSPVAARSVSRHVHLRRGKLRSTFYAKWRDADGVFHQDKLGLLWEGKGPPPAGYLRDKDAQSALQAILTDARRGAVEQRRTAATFDLVAEEWLAWGVRDRDWKPSTLSDNRSVVNHHLVPAFAGRPVEKISPEDIEQWRDELIDDRGASRRTANKCLIIIGAVLERAVKAHGLLRNPAREVAKLRERYDPNQYDFYSPEEIEQLGTAAASDQDRTVFLTAAFTGLRMGELIALRWGDVDFDTEALHVYGSYSLGTLTAPKSGLTRTVPMAEQVRDLLKEHQGRVAHDRADLVFGGERGEFLDGSALRRRYKKALENAGLRALRFHDLRHTFGSIAINQATIVQVQAWMGHSDVQTTMKYMHHRSRAGDTRLLSAAFRPKKRRTTGSST
ncbi:MAG: site-specific integrase [Actinomycetota bacterium]|nr:site-specific integrase [Actinomycetota bacterium]